MASEQRCRALPALRQGQPPQRALGGGGGGGGDGGGVSGDGGGDGGRKEKEAGTRAAVGPETNGTGFKCQTCK